MVFDDCVVTDKLAHYVATPDELAFFHRHYFSDCVVAVVATGGTAGVGTLRVRVTQAMCHAHSTKVRIFQTEVWRAIYVDDVRDTRLVCTGVLVFKYPIGVDHSYGSAIILEQYLPHLRYRVGSLITGLHRAGARDAMTTASIQLSIDHLVRKPYDYVYMIMLDITGFIPTTAVHGLVY